MSATPKQCSECSYLGREALQCVRRGCRRWVCFPCSCADLRARASGRWLCLSCAGLQATVTELQGRLSHYLLPGIGGLSESDRPAFAQLVFDLLDNCQWDLFASAMPMLVSLCSHCMDDGDPCPIDPFHGICYEGLGYLDAAAARRIAEDAAARLRASAFASAPSQLRRSANDPGFHLWCMPALLAPSPGGQRECLQLGVGRSGRVEERGVGAASRDRFPALLGSSSALTLSDRARLLALPTVRIGFFSGEFGEHVTSDLIGALLDRFGRAHEGGGTRLELHIFAVASDLDSLDPLVSACGQSLTVLSPDLSDHQIACEIARRGVHMLVNIGGFTDQSRNGVFAFRPAPVSGSYLAYPGTMGDGVFDFIVLDPVICPADQRSRITEQCVMHMPFSYQCRSHSVRHLSALEPGPEHTREAYGLPSDGFVFCCFCRLGRICPELWATWMRILRETGHVNSVLWLAATSRLAVEALRQRAADAGVDSRRIIFAPYVAPKTAHLIRAGLADCCLDTWFHNGHTSSTDVLFVGVPMVTREGSTVPSRVGTSLLRALLMQNMVTKTADDYAKLAVAMATDRGKYVSVKNTLIRMRTVGAAFDESVFYQHFASGLRRVWDMFGQGAFSDFRVDPAYNPSSRHSERMQRSMDVWSLKSREERLHLELLKEVERFPFSGESAALQRVVTVVRSNGNQLTLEEARELLRGLTVKEGNVGDAFFGRMLRRYRLDVLNSLSVPDLLAIGSGGQSPVTIYRLGSVRRDDGDEWGQKLSEFHADPGVRQHIAQISGNSVRYLGLSDCGDKGKGLRAVGTVPPRTRIAIFTGSVSEMLASNRGNYLMSMGHNVLGFNYESVIDGESDLGGVEGLPIQCLAQLCNHSCTPNCVSSLIDSRNGIPIVYISSGDEPIPAGAEITISYSASYWKTGMPPRSLPRGRKITRCLCNNGECPQQRWRLDVLTEGASAAEARAAEARAAEARAAEARAAEARAAEARAAEARAAEARAAEARAEAARAVAARAEGARAAEARAAEARAEAARAEEARAAEARAAQAEAAAAAVEARAEAARAAEARAAEARAAEARAAEAATAEAERVAAVAAERMRIAEARIVAAEARTVRAAAAARAAELVRAAEARAAQAEAVAAAAEAAAAGVAAGDSAATEVGNPAATEVRGMMPAEVSIVPPLPPMLSLPDINVDSVQRNGRFSLPGVPVSISFQFQLAPLPPPPSFQIQPVPQPPNSPQLGIFPSETGLEPLSLSRLPSPDLDRLFSEAPPSQPSGEVLSFFNENQQPRAEYLQSADPLPALPLSAPDFQQQMFPPGGDCNTGSGSVSGSVSGSAMFAFRKRQRGEQQLSAMQLKRLMKATDGETIGNIFVGGRISSDVVPPKNQTKHRVSL